MKRRKKEETLFDVLVKELGSKLATYNSEQLYTYIGLDIPPSRLVRDALEVLGFPVERRHYQSNLRRMTEYIVNKALIKDAYRILRREFGNINSPYFPSPEDTFTLLPRCLTKRENDPSYQIVLNERQIESAIEELRNATKEKNRERREISLSKFKHLSKF